MASDRQARLSHFLHIDFRMLFSSFSCRVISACYFNTISQYLNLMELSIIHSRIALQCEVTVLTCVLSYLDEMPQKKVRCDQLYANLLTKTRFRIITSDLEGG